MGLLKKLRNKVQGAVRRMKSKFDNLGSYTGSPEGDTAHERPEQDVDDL